MPSRNPRDRRATVEYPTLQWVLSAYTAAFALGLITSGRLGDLIGRRRLFLLITPLIEGRELGWPFYSSAWAGRRCTPA
ncbi:hypothetical protein [Streptomyces violaceusniger]|uniref:Major facilitator superfamily (MFS) profile domain-containing protein n=1 Tax=Streptomyces violaceusniger TaxID=68280 RepID=A0A4D4KZA8_STRVO|nr:hypothetical protein SVIO_018020 [Streptomyces violaceusniger]